MLILDQTTREGWEYPVASDNRRMLYGSMRFIFQKVLNQLRESH